MSNDNNKSAFDIDDSEKITEDKIMVNPTDFHDPINEDQSKKIWKVIIFAVVAVIALAVVLFATINPLVKNAEKTKETNTPQPTNTSETETKAKTNNPIMKLYPKAPTVKVENTTSKLNKNTITTNKNKLTFDSSVKLSKTVTACETRNPTDLCLSSYAKQNDKQYDIYYLKDAAHSRIFENAENTKKLNITGAQASATLTLKTEDNEKPALVILNKNSSGYMILNSDNSKNTEEDMETLATSIKAE